MGEEIFGLLPVTEYPDLRATERELKLLDQLYGLYTEVLDTIRVRLSVCYGYVCVCVDIYMCVYVCLCFVYVCLCCFVRMDVRNCSKHTHH